MTGPMICASTFDACVVAFLLGLAVLVMCAYTIHFARCASLGRRLLRACANDLDIAVVHIYLIESDHQLLLRNLKK